MASSAAEPEYQAAAFVPIPIDLFVSKKHPGLAPGDLGFANSSGDIVFRAIRRASSGSQEYSDHSKRLVLDAHGNPLFSICRTHKGSWQAFKGRNYEEKDLAFRVQRTLNKFTRTELEVFPVRENIEEPTSDLKVKGCPFRRSCTIYTGDSIVAQTSLMYKLHQILVPRSKFRLTIYPESTDHGFIVALIVIFLDA